jgi:pyoverdine/dityrosine biosynthesis protein Dit1
MKSMESVRVTAMSAAKRLLDARQAMGMLVQPQSTEDLMRMIEHMAKTPRKYGVILMPYEKRAIPKWHTMRRLWQVMELKTAAQKDMNAGPPA